MFGLLTNTIKGLTRIVKYILGVMFKPLLRSKHIIEESKLAHTQRKRFIRKFNKQMKKGLRNNDEIY